MDENKLSYRRIRNDVHIRLNNKEAATFLALMFYSDFNTGESHVIHKTLRDKTGIPESTLKKYLKELAEKGFTNPNRPYLKSMYDRPPPTAILVVRHHKVSPDV